jgi:hypothetical protein
MRYRQPRIDEGVLVEVCECGDIREVDARTFFEQARKENVLHLFDFNSHEPTMERRRLEQERTKE